MATSASLTPMSYETKLYGYHDTPISPLEYEIQQLKTKSLHVDFIAVKFGHTMDYASQKDIMA